MITWWLILLAVLLGLMIVGLSFYFVWLYSSAADDGAAYFPKTVAICGLSLACITVLLLPFDVATRSDPTSFTAVTETTTATQDMWEGVLWTQAIFILVIIPFTTFYYEALDPEDPSFVNQIIPAFLYTLGLNIFFWLITGLAWLFAGFVELPYYSYSGVGQAKGPLDASLVYIDYKSVEVLELRVSIFVYVIAMIALFGWMLCCFWIGVGLIALPYDAIMDFMHRPAPITKAQFDAEVLTIAQRAKTLMDEGKALDREQRRKNNTSVRQKVNEFRNEVLDLEDKLEEQIVAYKEQGGSPFVTYGKLFGGIFGVVLTILWFLHMLLYNGVRVHVFLNDMLVALDDAFALLGVIAYAVFAGYLLLCAVKGNAKIGMRIVFFTVHPLKQGDTLMNSMLFNIGLICISSVTVVQFCATSFAIYASNTSVDALLNIYVRRLKNVGTGIWTFQWIMMAVAFLSIIWVILCPRKKPEEDKEGRKRR